MARAGYKFGVVLHLNIVVLHCTCISPKLFTIFTWLNTVVLSSKIDVAIN